MGKGGHILFTMKSYTLTAGPLLTHMQVYYLMRLDQKNCFPAGTDGNRRPFSFIPRAPVSFPSAFLVLPFPASSIGYKKTRESYRKRLFPWQHSLDNHQLCTPCCTTDPVSCLSFHFHGPKTRRNAPIIHGSSFPKKTCTWYP